MPQVRAKAKVMGLVPSKKKKADLIREIQQAEGNAVCYATGQSAVCGQDSCAWRDDCK